MNMKHKKNIAILVLTAMLCSILPMSAFAVVDEEITVDDISYKVMTEGAQSTTGTVMVWNGRAITASVVTIPETIVQNGITYTVTEIGEAAFSNTGLTSITIPDSVTTIGKHAFYGCASLTSITIPDSVTSIGDAAFILCTGLTSIDISDSVTSIGNAVFSECSSLTSITIPDSVTSIGEQAFSRTGLTSIIIPDSVTSIGKGAFLFCTGLTSIDISDSVTSVENSAFSGCTSLISIDIPDSVTSIGEWAFYDCVGLTSITIPESVTSIGDSAFSYCSSLTSITIPDSVTSIGNSAFSDCSSLTSIIIPDSVTSIGEWAFYDCSSLTSITIPDSVTSIGDKAFIRCRALTSVNVSCVWDDSLYSFADNVTVNKNHADTDNNYVCDICEKVTVPANMTLASGLLYKNATSTIKLPDMPMESNHGTPTSSAYNFIVSAEMIDGSLVVTGSAEVVDGDTYIVIIPVIGEDNGGNKYKKYDVTVTLTGKVHGHDWTGAWGTNDTHHWRECANSDCDVTDITAKGEYGAHAYTNGICVCGKSIGNDGGTAPSYGGGYTPTPSVSDKVEITVPDAVGSDVKVEAKTITTSTLNDVKDIAAESDNLTVIGGKNSAVQITAKENGKALDAFVQPVTVTVPVSASALKDVADTGKLTLALVTTDDNGNTKLEYVGGSYDADKGTFSAYTDKPGNYVLVEKADLIKIELTIDHPVALVNDKPVVKDVPSRIVNDRTLVPVAYIAYAMDAKVLWVEHDRKVIIVK